MTPSHPRAGEEHYATVDWTNIPVREAWARCICGWTGPRVRYKEDARAHARQHERLGTEAPCGPESSPSKDTTPDA